MCTCRDTGTSFDVCACRADGVAVWHESKSFVNVNERRWHISTVPRGRGALDREGSAGVERRLGLDGLDVFGAVRGRLVLGLLVLHGVDDLVVSGSNRRARDGADDEDPARIYDVGVGADRNFDRFSLDILLIWPLNAPRRRVSDAGANPSMRL